MKILFFPIIFSFSKLEKWLSDKKFADSKAIKFVVNNYSEQIIFAIDNAEKWVLS